MFPLLFLATALIPACSSNSDKSGSETETMQDGDGSDMHATHDSDQEIKAVAVTFTDVDPGVSSFMKSMTRDYLGVKNALVAARAEEAGSAASGMLTAMKNFDKSLLSADQKQVFDEAETGLREEVEKISGLDDIEKQRALFPVMSKHMYEMVKAFGAGMTLYHDHCPMYQDGSMWLSETMEIRNPFYGEKMMTCGSPVEMIQ